MPKSEKSFKIRNLQVLYWLIFALCFGAFAFHLVYQAVKTSATVDEPAHILAGHRHLQCGDFGINPEHPPMLKMVSALPLAFQNWKEPPFECGSRLTTKVELFLYGPKFVVQNGIDKTVIPTRLAASVFGILLAVFLFIAVWKMFGQLEALTALAIFAFEPNLIANTPMVTTDLVISATSFAAVVAIYYFCQKPSAPRFGLAGLAFGLMLASKHTAVVFIPILFGLMIADSLIYRGEEESFTKMFLRQTFNFTGIFLIGLLILWAFYGFRYRAIPNADAPTVTVAEYIAANGRPEMLGSIPAKLAGLGAKTHIFPESYMLGVADVVASGSRNMFLFDRGYPTGKWFYFPISFSIKSSVALLILLPLGFRSAFANRERRREMIFILVPPLLYFAVALTSQLNIGVRHILPVYPFFIVAAAVGAVFSARKVYVFRYLLIVLLCYHAFSTSKIAPDYLAFANDFWGGTSQNYKNFRDPSLDNGQNLKFMKEYVERNKIADCWTAGSNNIAIIRAAQPCRVMPGSFPLSVSDEPQEVIPPVIEGTVLLAAISMPPRGGAEYAPIMQTEPIDRIANGVFVYRGRFAIPLASALSHVERTNQLMLSNRFAEALADAQKAVELAPDDARTHFALGSAFARNGQSEAANAEFQKTIEIGKTNPGLFRRFEVSAEQEIKRLHENQ
ncbi:MAG: glycosyltransferase family 39 protein [Pyrinomonadaceae bacterium]|nr:glycosyltransferase family 39 protein [Pyrinomonadaceae bacterium]